MGKAKKKSQPPRVASMSALRGQFTRTKTQLAKEKELSTKLQNKQKELEQANQDQMKQISELKALLEKSKSDPPDPSIKKTLENSDTEQEVDQDSDNESLSENMDLREHIDSLTGVKPAFQIYR